MKGVSTHIAFLDCHPLFITDVLLNSQPLFNQLRNKLMHLRMETIHNNHHHDHSKVRIRAIIYHRRPELPLSPAEPPLRLRIHLLHQSFLEHHQLKFQHRHQRKKPTPKNRKRKKWNQTDRQVAINGMIQYLLNGIQVRIYMNAAGNIFIKLMNKTSGTFFTNLYCHLLQAYYFWELSYGQHYAHYIVTYAIAYNYFNKSDIELISYYASPENEMCRNKVSIKYISCCDFSDDFRIFCGDLGNEVNEDILSRAFTKYPSFQRARVVRDRATKKSKGFGFVSFKDGKDWLRALKEMNGISPSQLKKWNSK